MTPAPAGTGGPRAEDAGAALAFSCPRCGADVQAAFYGPCDACRTELRATVAGVRRTVDDVVYEPKMNVTPNAVATKD